MFKIIQQQLKVRKQEILLELGIEAAVFLVMFIIMNVIMRQSDADTTFPLATFTTFFLIFIYSFILGANNFCHEFNSAIKMGRTRRNFMFGFTVVSLMFYAIQLVVLYALNVFESYAIRTMYAGIPMELSLDSFLKPQYLLIMVVALMVINVTFGALQLKFGKYGNMIVAVVYLLICLLPGRISSAMSSDSPSLLSMLGNAIINTLNSMSAISIVGVIIAIMLFMYVAIILMVRKQHIIN